MSAYAPPIGVERKDKTLRTSFPSWKECFQLDGTFCQKKKKEEKSGERMCYQISLRNAALSLPFCKFTRYISVTKALRRPAEKRY